MKTLAEVLTQQPVFMNDFHGRLDVFNDFSDDYGLTDVEYDTQPSYMDDTRWEDLKSAADKLLSKHDDENILFASYGNANYSGEAFVLFEKDGELFEVNGGHCSCYGLEGQWEPEETTLAALEHRLLNGTFGEDSWSDNNFKQRLCEFLGVEFKRNMQTGWS